MKNSIEIDNNEKYKNIFLFLLIVLFTTVRLVNIGNMTEFSGDAADIWKTIVSINTDNVYPSYVLYKGIFSLYPYVWLYKLAVLLNTNDFLFIMIYHGVLFGYITVYGLPKIVNNFFNIEVKLWQKILFAFITYLFWNNYHVFDCLMVDLPTCSLFIISVVEIVKFKNNIDNNKHLLYLILFGVSCSFFANISGQYILSSLCLMIYVIFIIIKQQNNPKKRILDIIVLFFSYFSFIILNKLFFIFFIEIISNKQITSSTGMSWIKRGLIYMMPIIRQFYGPTLYDQRGYQILEYLFGTEKGIELWKSAAAGGYVISIKEYILCFLKTPINFILLYINRLIVIFNDDLGSFNILNLILHNSLTFLCIINLFMLSKSNKNDSINSIIMIICSFFSVVPCLALCVEMRYTIGLQSFVFGYALLGPFIPTFVKKNSLKKFRKTKNDWPFLIKIAVLYIIFITINITLFGLICSQSNVSNFLF